MLERFSAILAIYWCFEHTINWKSQDTIFLNKKTDLNQKIWFFILKNHDFCQPWFMRIFAEVLWGGASNDSGMLRTAIFSVFTGCFFPKLYRRGLCYYVVICRHMQSVVSFSVMPKCMTLNDLEWLFCVKLFSCWFGWLRPCDFRKIIARKLIKIDTYCQRCKSSAGTLVSGNIRFVWIFAQIRY